jgi:hypothetical protein
MSRTAALRVVGISVLLFVLRIVAQNSGTPTHKPVAARDYSFTVAADQVWNDAGLDCNREIEPMFTEA